MTIHFRPTEQFEWWDGQKHMATYLTKFTYVVRPGNDKLAAKVKEWLDSGKVQLVAGPAAGSVAATATVEEK